MAKKNCQSPAGERPARATPRGPPGGGRRGPETDGVRGWTWQKKLSESGRSRPARVPPGGGGPWRVSKATSPLDLAQSSPVPPPAGGRLEGTSAAAGGNAVRSSKGAESGSLESPTGGTTFHFQPRFNVVPTATRTLFQRHLNRNCPVGWRLCGEDGFEGPEALGTRGGWVSWTPTGHATLKQLLINGWNVGKRLIGRLNGG